VFVLPHIEDINFLFSSICGLVWIARLVGPIIPTSEFHHLRVINKVSTTERSSYGHTESN